MLKLKQPTSQIAAGIRRSSGFNLLKMPDDRRHGLGDYRAECRNPLYQQSQNSLWLREQEDILAGKLFVSPKPINDPLGHWQ